MERGNPIGCHAFLCFGVKGRGVSGATLNMPAHVIALSLISYRRWCVMTCEQEMPVP